MENSGQVERKKISIRKSPEAVSPEPGPTPPLFRPIPPKRESGPAVAIAIAVIVSIVVIFFIQKGVTHLRDQVKEIARVERERAESEKERDALKFKINGMTLELERVSADMARQEEQDRRELTQRLKDKFDASLADLRKQIGEVNGQIAETKSRGDAESSEQTTKLAAKIAEMKGNVEKLERENQAMRIWLNANRKTLHP